MWCFGAMLVYYWFPGYIIQAMSYFNWMTWITPDNVNLAAITGSIGGLGLNPFPTWDWNQLVFDLDPLIDPYYSTVDRFLGALITAPIMITVVGLDAWSFGRVGWNMRGI